MMDRGAPAGAKPTARRVTAGALALVAAVLTGGTAQPLPAAERAAVVPVAPLSVALNAAAYRPLPDGAMFVIRRDDDSREHDAIHAALAAALPASAGTGPTLEMSFDVYVIRSGVPVLGMDMLEMEEPRGDAARQAERPPSVDATELRGRTGALEGNVFHQRQDSFAAVMRLEVTVFDPRTGAYLWRGWVDSPLNGLSRAQVTELVAGPLLDTLGETVAGRTTVIEVPGAMGGAAGR
ncbi:hypothetical protein [uncultured Rhodospira sp.]|uniref:hypothetical protein n=1 Tax=uncultured Rhodospira sp. TaxID=1936189 RepID=UPI002602E3DD|nr:hypothetical protein [uncultured Rhodospira sp.]